MTVHAKEISVVFLAQHHSMVEAIRNTVILQCFDTARWLTPPRRHGQSGTLFQHSSTLYRTDGRTFYRTDEHCTVY